MVRRPAADDGRDLLAELRGQLLAGMAVDEGRDRLIGFPAVFLLAVVDQGRAGPANRPTLAVALVEDEGLERIQL